MSQLDAVLRHRRHQVATQTSRYCEPLGLHNIERYAKPDRMLCSSWVAHVSSHASHPYHWVPKTSIFLLACPVESSHRSCRSAVIDKGFRGALRLCVSMRKRGSTQPSGSLRSHRVDQGTLVVYLCYSNRPDPMHLRIPVGSSFYITSRWG